MSSAESSVVQKIVVDTSFVDGFCSSAKDFASSGIEVSYTPGLVGTGKGVPYIFCMFCRRR